MSIKDLECECGSGTLYSACCAPYHLKCKLPETAEALMRSRYSAFVRNETVYLVETTDPRKLTPRLKEDIEKGNEGVFWLGLNILSTRQGGINDKVGKVEFVASFRHNGDILEHHELSRFKKYKGRWYYWDAEFLD